MNRLATSIVTALALAFAGSAFAADFTDGEIRKIDKEAARLTIRHAEIKNLEMPPMTMVFHVKDAKMLDQVKVGDKVRFSAEKLGGNYTVTALEPAAK